jgi:hypothetical protein
MRSMKFFSLSALDWTWVEFAQVVGAFDAKKRCLGPQNASRSLGPEKLLKIVNCATIKETEKRKETMVWVQVEYVGGHQYPPGLFLHP